MLDFHLISAIYFTALLFISITKTIVSYNLQKYVLLPNFSRDPNSPALPVEIMSAAALKEETVAEEEEGEDKNDIAILSTLTEPVTTEGLPGWETEREGKFPGCVTPKSEDQMLKPSLVCPKRPNKRRPTMMRKFGTHRNFIPVPDDIESVFRALPFSLPKRRKIA